MKRSITITLALVMGAAGVSRGSTFEPAAIAPEAGVETFHRGVAVEKLDRELFSNPYASVVIANVDVYDTFPYLEARTFQVVSDPSWNRLLFGETGIKTRARGTAGAESSSR